MKRMLPALCLFAGLALATSAAATIYSINPQTNNSCCSDFSAWLQIPVSAGTHTITLVSGPQPPCPDNGWGENLLVWPSGLGPSCSDFTEFALNGMGDSKTLTFADDGFFRVGVEHEPGVTITGTMTVRVDGHTYMVDPVVHVKCCTDTSNWLWIPITTPGAYCFMLVGAPFPPCPNNGWGADVLMKPSGIGSCNDYAWTSLNGERDGVPLVFVEPGGVFVGIEDGFASDNQGLITIAVEPCEPPIPVSVETWGRVKSRYAD